jgi:hypothetical protein
MSGTYFVIGLILGAALIVAPQALSLLHTLHALSIALAQ